MQRGSHAQGVYPAQYASRMKMIARKLYEIWNQRGHEEEKF